ncbi:hypothetical protein [Streptomyces sp. NPDC013187]|uniref:hypothetical protein n=1 Tax=Streptomyces sp. NPDC013187 TaxID=3364865 RepID=UPI00369F1011
MQYNVIWTYGADHVQVQWFDKTENHDGWQDFKTVSIPGDYKGKPCRDIAKGMDEHLKVICRGLVRDWEGSSGMEEFRDEWAMHTWEERQKVSYKSVRGGIVLGVVKETKRLGTRRVVLVRVTSRNNPLYRCGEIVEFSTTDPWLKSREV